MTLAQYLRLEARDARARARAMPGTRAGSNLHGRADALMFAAQKAEEWPNRSPDPIADAVASQQVTT